MRTLRQTKKSMSPHTYVLHKKRTLLVEGSLIKSERLVWEKTEYQNLIFFEREQFSWLFVVSKHPVTWWIVWIRNCSVLAKQKQQDRIERWIIEPIWLPKWDAFARNWAYWHRRYMLFTKDVLQHGRFWRFCVFWTKKTSLQKKNTNSLKKVQKMTLEAFDKTLTRAPEQTKWAGGF